MLNPFVAAFMNAMNTKSPVKGKYDYKLLGYRSNGVPIYKQIRIDRSKKYPNK